MNDLLHELEVVLINKDGLRLTIFKESSQRNTPTEHELRFKVKYETNTHMEHSKLGPWEIVSSKWNT